MFYSSAAGGTKPDFIERICVNLMNPIRERRSFMKKKFQGIGSIHLFCLLVAVAVFLLSSGVSYAAQALLTDDTYTDAHHASAQYAVKPYIKVNDSAEQTGYLKLD